MSLDTTTFPDRPLCFGDGSTNLSCIVPSQSMIDFLNITKPWIYKEAYCINPPKDSCAFGYCANPDVAGPAVRIATYISTICTSIVILYSPEEVSDAFWSQSLQIYSLLIAGIIAIAARELTRLHAVFVLIDITSPLDLYILILALRSVLLHHKTRLHPVFGAETRWRAILSLSTVLAILPIWLSLYLIVMLRPTWFQQTACDNVFRDGLVGQFFLGPLFLLVGSSWAEKAMLVLPVIMLALAWVIAIVAHRKELLKRDLRKNPVEIWHKATQRYPFLKFCTLILFPSLVWVGMLESGAVFSNEYFEPTYGQLLAIFVAVPPVVHCLRMYKRCWAWFVNLTWVRFVSGRMDEPSYDVEMEASRHGKKASTNSVSYTGLYDPPENVGYSTKTGAPAYDSPANSDFELNDDDGSGQVLAKYQRASGPVSSRPGSVVLWGYEEVSSNLKHDSTLARPPDVGPVPSPPSTLATSHFLDPFEDQTEEKAQESDKEILLPKS